MHLRALFAIALAAACSTLEEPPGGTTHSDDTMQGESSTGDAVSVEAAPTTGESTGPTAPACHSYACIDDTDCEPGTSCLSVLSDDVPNICAAGCQADIDCETSCGAPLARCEGGLCTPVTCWRADPCEMGECRDYVDGISACFP